MRLLSTVQLTTVSLMDAGSKKERGEINSAEGTAVICQRHRWSLAFRRWAVNIRRLSQLAERGGP